MMMGVDRGFTALSRDSRTPSLSFDGSFAATIPVVFRTSAFVFPAKERVAKVFHSSALNRLLPMGASPVEGDVRLPALLRFAVDLLRRQVHRHEPARAERRVSRPRPV